MDFREHLSFFQISSGIFRKKYRGNTAVCKGQTQQMMWCLTVSHPSGSFHGREVKLSEGDHEAGFSGFRGIWPFLIAAPLAIVLPTVFENTL
jgi:hypothetical protein